MGFTGFCVWFVAGLLITSMIQALFGNLFITGFVVAIITGLLGGKE